MLFEAFLPFIILLQGIKLLSPFPTSALVQLMYYQEFIFCAKFGSVDGFVNFYFCLIFEDKYLVFKACFIHKLELL